VVRGRALRDDQFAKAIACGREVGAAELVATIKDAAQRDWRASAWLLERTRPAEFGRQNEPVTVCSSVRSLSIAELFCELPVEWSGIALLFS
jgi:hypothetical protein